MSLKVRGYCRSCSQQTLVLDGEGFVMCTNPECEMPNITAINLLANANQGIFADIVYRDIAGERLAQVATWGEQNHENGTSESNQPAADLARKKCQTAERHNAVTWLHILLEEVYEAAAEQSPKALRGELVQVGAVVVAWIEAIDRAES